LSGVEILVLTAVQNFEDARSVMHLCFTFQGLVPWAYIPNFCNIRWILNQTGFWKG